MKKLFIQSVLCMFVVAPALGQYDQNAWTGASSDDWNNKSNWSLDSVPTPCHQVVIPATSINPNPRLTSDIYISNLSFTGSAELLTNDFNTNFIVGSAAYQPLGYRPIGAQVNTRSLNDIYTSHRKTYVANDPNDYALKRSNTSCAPIFRFELRQGDHWVNESSGNTQNGALKERCELSQANPRIDFRNGNVEVWVAYSIYVEPGWPVLYSNNSYYCYLGQWHGSGTGTTASWALDLRNDSDLIIQTKGLDPNSTITQPNNLDTLTLTRGTWHDVVIKVVHSKNGTGAFKFWLDGDEKLDRTGLYIGFDDTTIGYWKYGIYRTHAAGDPQNNGANTMIVRYANMEVSTASLFSRVGNPRSRD